MKRLRFAWDVARLLWEERRRVVKYGPTVLGGIAMAMGIAYVVRNVEPFASVMRSKQWRAEEPRE